MTQIAITRNDDRVKTHLNQTFGGANFAYAHVDTEELVHSNLMMGATKAEILQYVSEDEFQAGLQYHQKEVAALEAETETELKERLAFNAEIFGRNPIR